ncbi:MAG: sulfatase-like hydrolase/transferase [Bdellovibrionota bacterium]
MGKIIVKFKEALAFFSFLSTPMLFIFIAQLIFILLSIKSKTLLVHEKMFVLFLSLFSIGLTILIYNFLLSFIRSRLLRAVANILFVMMYVGLLFYEYVRGSSLDIALIFYNSTEFFGAMGLASLIDNIDFWTGGLLILLLSLLIYLELKWNALSTVNSFKNRMPILIAGVLWIFLVLFFDQDRNSVNSLIRSMIRAYRLPSLYQADVWASETKFAALKLDDGKFWTEPSEHLLRPNIFIVIIESFNRKVVDKTTESGKVITPFFNKLKSEGVYIQNFYSNSMQSARGYVATLCSTIPSFRRKIMTNSKDLSLLCLPETLQSMGYQTLFSVGMADTSFDNMNDFFKTHGFDHVIGMGDNFLSEDDYKFVWGWGLQDDILYEKTFDFISSDLNKKAPIFAAIATVSSHQMFDNLPIELKKIFPKPENLEEAYINSINFADQSLESFFKLLRNHGLDRNSLVIVVGDHGYPLDEDRNTSNELTIFNDLFEVPLLIWWPDHISPKTISNCAYSQIDIAPTIKSILRKPTINHDAGTLIRFDEDCVSDRSIPLVQPYDGVKIASLIYPYKLVWHLASGKQELFNLEQDPQERHNVLKEDIDTSLRYKLDRGIFQILKNQKLVEENRLFPESIDLTQEFLQKRAP